MFTHTHQYRKLLSSILLAGLLMNTMGVSVYEVPVAQAAEGIYKPIPYQGKLRTSAGAAVADGDYNMQFKIFTAETGGSPVWTETWDTGTSQITMTGGLFTTYLGTHTAMTNVDFNSDNLYLQIEFDPGNDDTYEEIFSPRRRFGSVPYAINSDLLDGLEGSQFVRSDADDMLSGSLLITDNTTTSSSETADDGIALEVKGAFSGSNVFAANLLTASGELIIERSENSKLITLQDSTNNDSVSFYTGTGDPNGIVLAELGSLFFASDTGKLWKNDVGGQDSWSEIIDTTIGDSQYVNVSGDTMTGALTINLDSGTLGLDVKQTMSGATIIASNKLVSSGSLTVTGDAIFDTNTLFIDSSNNMVGVLTVNPEAELDVLGTVSGSVLHASNAVTSSGSLRVDGSVELRNFTSCTALETNSAGALVCGTDDGGSTAIAGQGLNKSGDVISLNTTITGSLVNFATVSGAHVHAQDLLTSSGDLIVENTLFVDQSTGMVGIATVNPEVALDVLGTVSGSVLHASDAVTSSGSLRVQSNAIFRGNVGIGTESPSTTLDVQGNGLFEGSGTARLTVRGNGGSASTRAEVRIDRTASARGGGVFVEGTTSGLEEWFIGVPYDGGSASNGFQIARHANQAEYIENAFLFLNTSGNVGIGTTNPEVKLDVIGTISGAIVYATDALRSSGALRVDGSVELRNFTSCTALETDANGNLVCGTDDGGGGSVVAGQGLNKSGDIISLNTTITGSLVNFATVSGAHVHAQDLLTSSGDLIVENTLFVDQSTGMVGIGTTSPDRPLHVQASGANADLKVTEYQDTAFGVQWLTEKARGTAASPSAVQDDDELGKFYFYGYDGDSFELGGGLKMEIDGTVSDGSLPTRILFETNAGAGQTERMRIDKDGNVGIGASAPETKLEVVGTISGTYLHAESDLTASGALIVEGNSTLNAALTVTGNATFDTNTLFVNSSTNRVGILNTNPEVALDVLGTVSGSVLHASNAVTSSGSLRVDGSEITLRNFTSCTALETNSAGALVCGTDDSGGGGLWTDNTSHIEYSGTASGSQLHAEDTLSSSGKLVIETSENSDFITLKDETNGDSVSIKTGTGDPNGTVSGQLGSLFMASDTGKIWRNNDGATQWVELISGSGSIHMAQMTKGVAQSIPSGSETQVTLDTEIFDIGDIADSTGDNRFEIKKAGKYLINARIESASSVMDDGELMDVRIYKNGTNMHIHRGYSPALNQTILVDTNIILDLAANDNIEFRLYHNEGSAWNTRTDRGIPTMSVVQLDGIAAGAGLWTDSGSTTYLGSVNDNISIGGTEAETKLEVVGTISGSYVHAENDLTASGALIVEGNVTVDTNTFFVDSSNNRVGILNTNPEVAFDVLGTVSGSVLHASNAVTSSGSLRVDGSEITLRNFTSCTALETNSAGALVCGTDDGGSTAIAGQGLNKSGDVISLNTTITGSLVNFATVSGAHVHAQDLLTSSGDLIVEGEIKNGLIAWWSLDEGTGTSATDIVNSIAGTLTNSPAWVTGKFDRGVDFDGTDDHIVTANVIPYIENQTTGTISVWVRPESTGANRNVFSLGHDSSSTIFNVQARSDDKVRLYLHNVGSDEIILETDSAVLSTEWTHIVAVQDGIAPVLYIDGVAVAQTETGGDPTKWFSDISLDTSYIGARKFNGGSVGSFFKGKIDDLRVFDRPLSAKEVAELYRHNSSSFADGGTISNTLLSDSTFGIGTDNVSEKLEVAGTISGSYLHAESDLTASGALIVEGNSTLNAALTVTGNATFDTNTLFVNSSTNRVGILNTNPEVALDVLGTVSGTILHASDEITSSGSLRVQSNAIFRANVGIGTENPSTTLDVQGNGLFEGSGTARLTVRGNGGSASTRAEVRIDRTASARGGGVFVEGTTSGLEEWFIGVPYDGGSASNGFQIARHANQAEYIENAFLFLNTSGNVGIGTTNPEVKLDVIGTISGATVYATDALRSSGALRIDGSVELRNFTSCTALETDANGNLVCGTDDGGGGGITTAIGDERYVNIAGDTMTGGLHINLGGSDADAIESGLALEVDGTASGWQIHAEQWLTASGNTILGDASTDTVTVNAQVSSHLVPSATATYDLGSSTNRWRDLYISGESLHMGVDGNEAIFNYDTTSNYLGFDPDGDSTNEVVITDAGRIGVGTTSPESAIEALGTISGTYLHAESDLTASGALIVEGNSTLNAALTVTGNATFDTNTLFVNSSTNRVGILNTNPEVALDVLGTVSGSVLHASDAITSSGALRVDGSIELRNFTSCTALETDANGNLVCGTDDTGGGGGGLDTGIGDERYVNIAGDTMTGALFINLGGSALDSIESGLALEINGAASGTQMHINDLFTVSGAIIQDAKTFTQVGSIAHSEGTTELNDSFGIDIEGDYAYIASYDTGAANQGGVQIVDVSDPTNPVHVGKITDSASTTLAGVRDIKVIGNYAYVTSYIEDAFTVLDVSDPTTPVQVGSLTGSTLTELDGAWGLDIAGNYAYVAGRLDDGIEIIDITDPFNPVHAGKMADNGSTLLNGPIDIEIDGQYAYITAYDDNGLQILDISDPENPLHVTSVADGDPRKLGGIRDITIIGQYAYIVSTTDNALQIFDISDPENPTHVSSLVDDASSSFASPLRLGFAGNFAYMTSATDDSITMIDVSDPTNPTIVKTLIDDGNHFLDGARDIVVNGRYAYVTSGTVSGADDGVAIFDLHGTQLHAAEIGSLEVVGLKVLQKAEIHQGLKVDNGLQVGGGAHIRGTTGISVQSGVALMIDSDDVNDAGLRISMHSDDANQNPHILFGYDNVFDANLFRSGGNDLTMSGSLNLNSPAFDGVYYDDGGSYNDHTTDAAISARGNSFTIISDSNTEDYMYVGLETPFTTIYIDFETEGSDVTLDVEYYNGSTYTDVGGFTDTTDNFGNDGTIQFDAPDDWVKKIEESKNLYWIRIHSNDNESAEATIYSISPTQEHIFQVHAQAGDASPLIYTNREGRVGFGTNTLNNGKVYIKTATNWNDEALILDADTGVSATHDLFKIISDNGSTDNTIFRVRADGETYTEASFNSMGADYAEWFYSDDNNLKPGEVVCIDITQENAVERCTNTSDGNVMGIISTNPAFVGNQITGADGVMPPNYFLVGLIGQVPTKVIDENGPIRPGDALTSAKKKGFAKRALPGDPTVGIALEGLEEGEKKGKINVLISRRNSSVTVETVEEHVLQTISAMEIEDEVEMLIHNAMNTLGVEESIATEIANQFGDLDLSSAIEAALEARDEESQSGTIMWNAYQDLMEQLSAVKDDLTAFSGSLSLDESEKVRESESQKDEDAEDARDAGEDSENENGDELVVNPEDIADGLEIVSAQNIEELIVSEALDVRGDITIAGLATFLGDVEVDGDLTISGSLIVNNHQAGYAVIVRAGTGVDVPFDTLFSAAPIVTASSNTFDPWKIASTTATGFTIEVAKPAQEQITFQWQATLVLDPHTITGELAGMTSFTIDQFGTPLSSNPIWNACIRNQVLIDSSGQPFNCSRYHDKSVWTHPDLNITFMWDREKTPSLILPEGYETMVENVSMPESLNSSTNISEKDQESESQKDEEVENVSEESEESNDTEKSEETNESEDETVEENINNEESSDTEDASNESIENEETENDSSHESDDVEDAPEEASESEEQHSAAQDPHLPQDQEVESEDTSDESEDAETDEANEEVEETESEEESSEPEVEIIE